ncbi:amidohydrolase [Stenotrophomonas pictorum JCM 9942]|uniref:Amidohydrolase n=2 Tax=Stenotrophomonas pictorum TaxID=86184 RepID=A0A0R0A4L0_9GAMM|nr:amidohydrolase [Stenotrophomonas pictorum]KRG39641.1 amidohydrolase [Stenotrophomonas pictorum JCM 9942]
MRRLACVALLLPCLHVLSASAEVKLLVAETIRTGDPAQPVVGAMAWESDTGRVLDVGSADALLQLYPQAPRIDLGEATVVPGLIDAHAHLVYLGNTLSQADLSGAKSRAEVVERLKAFEKTLAPGEWLLGRGWDQNRWDNTDFPTVADLDAAFPQRPVYLDRVDGHAGWVNSAALRIAEEGGKSLAGDWQPAGGRIVRDAAGKPTGVLVDGAAALVSAHIPALDEAAREKRLHAALQEAVRNGLTGVHDMGVSREDLALMKRLADQGRLPLRIDAYADGNQAALDDLCRSGLYQHAGGRLQMRGVKLFMDGALGSRGAALLADYSDDPHNHGLLMTSPADFELAVRKADGCKVQVATHAIGDRGNRIVLDTYEKVLGARKGDDHRWRVEHAQVVALEDIARFAPLGVVASMQPTHATSDMGWAEQRVGPERIKGAYAWQRYLHSGARLALGSDFPVEQVDPRLGLYAAVTRQDRDGQPPGGWQPEQRLSAAEALRGFTRDAAWAGHDEAEVGTLKRGLRADFVVLDRDPLTVAAGELDELKVLSTWVDGEPVYMSGQAQAD